MAGNRAGRIAAGVATLGASLVIAGPSLASADEDGQRSEGLSPHHPNRVLVGFKAGVSEPEAERIIERRAGRRLEGADPEVARIEVARTEPGQSVPEAIEALEESKRVAYAEPDYLLRTQVVPSDPNFSSLWAHRNTGQLVFGIRGIADADQDTVEAWDTATGSDSVVVAVIDSGISPTHSDLDANIWKNPGETGDGKESNGVDDDGNGYVDDWRGWSIARESNDISDPHGHGTFVAGVIGAEANGGGRAVGVSWDVSLMPVQTGTEGTFWTSAAIAGMHYAAENGAQVANLSFSGSRSETMRAAIASHPEMLFVAAAGNDNGLDVDDIQLDPCSAPGDNVICVASSNQSDTRSWFSNYGDETVDLAAPGENIVSAYSTEETGDGYAVGNGTSNAAPQVAGTVALLLSLRPNARPWWLRQQILDSVDVLPAFDGLVASSGRLNVASAVSAVEADDDHEAPQTEITDGPGDDELHQSTTATFSYEADELADFECQLDDGPWQTCPRQGKTYTGLSEGQHAFRVRAIDGPGNVDDSPAERSFQVAVPPETEIAAAPQARTNETSAEFVYSSDDSEASFECRLDGGSWQDCPAEGQDYIGLGEGQHDFDVRAVDATGLADPTPAHHKWEIDTTAPTVSLKSTPPKLSGSAQATFTYEAEGDWDEFRCKRDSGSEAWCSPQGQTYSGLGSREHTFAVVAVDDVGNRSEPATYTWTVDTRVPETSLHERITNGADASFTYSSDGPDDEFQCQLDGGPWEDCPQEGKSYTGLPDGVHIFRVRAIAPTGNTDPTPAEHGWRVGSELEPEPPGNGGEAPETVITGGPSGWTNAKQVRFEFSAHGQATGFECRIDGISWWRECTSPILVGNLPDGEHRFEVRAINDTGVDPTPAFRVWNQDTVAPDTKITKRPAKKGSKRKAKFRYRADGADSFECKLDKRDWKPCPSSGKTFKVSYGKHTFRVRAIDRAGNVDASPAKATFKVRKKSKRRRR